MPFLQPWGCCFFPAVQRAQPGINPWHCTHRRAQRGAGHAHPSGVRWALCWCGRSRGSCWEQAVVGPRWWASSTTHTGCPARGPTPELPPHLGFTLCPGVSRALLWMLSKGSRLEGCRGARGPQPTPPPSPEQSPQLLHRAGASGTLAFPQHTPALRPLCCQSHRNTRALSPRCRHHGLFAEQMRLAPAPRGASVTRGEPPCFPACGGDAAALPPTPTGTNRTGASLWAAMPQATRPPLSCLLLPVSCSLAGDGAKASNCSKCDQ